jgi:hypothetical protein
MTAKKTAPRSPAARFRDVEAGYDWRVFGSPVEP